MKSQTIEKPNYPGSMLGTTTVAMPGSLPQTRDNFIAAIAASNIPSSSRGLFDMLPKIRLIEKHDAPELVLYSSVSAREDRIEELESLLFSNDSALDNVVCYHNRLLPARLVAILELAALYQHAGYKRAAVELLKLAEHSFFECAENSRLIAEELSDHMILLYLEFGAFGEAQKLVRRTAKLMVKTYYDSNDRRAVTVGEEFLVEQLTALINERERRANRRAERLRYFQPTKTERHLSNPFAQAFSPAMIPQGA